MENYTDMSTFNRVKKFRKPLVEINKKIDGLEEAMTTSGFYTMEEKLKLFEQLENTPPNK